MKFFLPIPSSWRNPKRLPIPTHAELVERVAKLSERVSRHEARFNRIEQLVWLNSSAFVAHPTKENLAALDRRNAKPGEIQPCQPGEEEVQP